MKKQKTYVVCVNSSYVRDAQIYNPTVVIDEQFQEIDPFDNIDDEQWCDADIDAFVAIVTANSELEACKKAGNANDYNPKCLYAIKID